MKMTKLSQSADRITIGKLGAARGLDGLLRIVPLTDFEGRFDSLQEVFVGEKIMQVERVKHIGGEIFIKFLGYSDRESAKVLTNKILSVDKSQAAPLNEGEFYTFDIIGCEVFDSSGKNLGVVENVLKTGSNDVFEVRGEKNILIPALKKVVSKIDVADKKIFVNESALEEI